MNLTSFNIAIIFFIFVCLFLYAVLYVLMYLNYRREAKYCKVQAWENFKDFVKLSLIPLMLVAICLIAAVIFKVFILSYLI